MAVQPTTRSTYTSTLWNSPARATHSTNAAKFGGPNAVIREGAKVKFNSGSVIWDVARVFEDGTLLLTSVAAGVKRSRRVTPASSSWTNLWMVDGKRVSRQMEEGAVPLGGGPNRNLDPGNVVTVGTSRIRWTVESVLRDGTVTLRTSNADKILRSTISPKSSMWYSMYLVNA